MNKNVDEFDYKSLQNQVILPETKLDFTGADFQRIMTALRNYIDENAINLYNGEGEVVAQGLLPSAQPISDLYSTLHRVYFRRYFEDGSTVSIEEFKRVVEERKVSAEKV